MNKTKVYSILRVLLIIFIIFFNFLSAYILLITDNFIIHSIGAIFFILFSIGYGYIGDQPPIKKITTIKQIIGYLFLSSLSYCYFFFIGLFIPDFSLTDLPSKFNTGAYFIYLLTILITGVIAFLGVSIGEKLSNKTEVIKATKRLLKRSE